MKRITFTCKVIYPVTSVVLRIQALNKEDALRIAIYQSKGRVTPPVCYVVRSNNTDVLRFLPDTDILPVGARPTHKPKGTPTVSVGA